MASTITAGNATNGLALSCDNTGILELKTGTGAGTTGLTIDASQNVTLATGIAGDFKMNSGYGSVATAYGCRAWVNFNGTGTVAIRASGNVSSITDNGTGDYTVNFTTAMSDANYSVGSCVAVDFSNTGSRVVNLAGATPTTTTCRISTHLPGTGAQDCLYVAIQVFR
jgi:uncharacterized protein (AIM24 family)